jgi:DNA-binding NtrC family response regulator
MSSCRLGLIAEDQSLTEAIQAHLRSSFGQMASVNPLQEYRPYLGPDQEDVLLLAVASTADAPTVRQVIQENHLRKGPPVLLLVGRGAEAAREEFARLNPYLAGCLHWPGQSSDLTPWLRKRVDRVRQPEAAKPETVEEQIERQLVCQTPSMLPMVQRVALAATHDVTVLLTGETGTGKTFLARLMHEYSQRKTQRFLIVPCGAMSANLVESEFFGHVAGAFTGADRAKVGKFAAVGKGTLVLEEIDTLGLEQQATLLRVIETGEFEPVGSNETQISQARIIVASNWNLE